jgi:hypothetical protein|tara:strand:+ start:438 stop:2372 length:1935 start_codon:yes stop_codon:yes gene_type:complete
MSVKNVTELDFDSIKANLKTHLKNQTEFADYDFEASGISQLVDLLAYNTHYNAVLAHMVSNEAFIDSAIKRNSVVSIAKTMGYVPRSARSAKANINLTVQPDASYSDTNLTLSNNSLFTSNVNGKNFSFIPDKDYSVPKSIVDGVTAFRFTDIVLLEGTRTATTEIIGAANRSGPIILPNDNVDTTTLTVKVQTSTTNFNAEVFALSETITGVTKTSKVYYLEERTDGFYQVVFGDGVLGKQLDVGNIVICEYILSNATAGNGARKFSSPTNITGSGETVTGTTTAASVGGFELENIDSIRFNAPRFNTAKGRVVTSTDYETAIKQSNPNIKSVTVWGGEDNVPPVYGKVYISLQPQTGFVITETEKDNLVTNVINPKLPVSLVTEFVTAEDLFIGFNIAVTFDPKITTQSADSIKTSVLAQITSHFNTNVNELKKNFFFSKLSKELDGVDESILANNIEMRLMKKITPKLGVASRYELRYNNKLLASSVRTNYFTANITGSQDEVYITDKPDETFTASQQYNGQRFNLARGELILKSKATNTVIGGTVGTIDYDTGYLDITSMKVDAISGATNSDIRVYITPHESAKNISTDSLVRATEEQSYAVTALPARNIILGLDDSNVDTTNNVKQGVAVTMISRIKDD